MNKRDLVRFFEAAGVDYTKGKAAKLVESVTGRAEGYAAFAAWYLMEDGELKVCQVSATTDSGVASGVVGAIAQKFGLSEDELQYDILSEFNDQAFGAAGVRSKCDEFLSYVQEQSSRLGASTEYNRARRFVSNAIRRASALAQEGGENRLSACTGSLERDMVLVILVTPNERPRF